jgi:hypothetical protein
VVASVYFCLWVKVNNAFLSPGSISPRHVPRNDNDPLSCAHQRPGLAASAPSRLSTAGAGGERSVTPLNGRGWRRALRHAHQRPGLAASAPSGLTSLSTLPCNVRCSELFMSHFKASVWPKCVE